MRQFTVSARRGVPGDNLRQMAAGVRVTFLVIGGALDRFLAAMAKGLRWRGGQAA